MIRIESKNSEERERNKTSIELDSSTYTPANETKRNERRRINEDGGSSLFDSFFLSSPFVSSHERRVH